MASRIVVRERCGFCGSRFELEGASDWRDAVATWRREHVCSVVDEVDDAPTSGVALVESISDDERRIGFHA